MGACTRKTGSLSEFPASCLPDCWRNTTPGRWRCSPPTTGGASIGFPAHGRWGGGAFVSRDKPETNDPAQVPLGQQLGPIRFPHPRTPPSYGGCPKSIPLPSPDARWTYRQPAAPTLAKDTVSAIRLRPPPFCCQCLSPWPSARFWLGPPPGTPCAAALPPIRRLTPTQAD